MTFEEFFKRKKINLQLLQVAEPELFAEFGSHYAQMGEKSFDHTKKYWFNSLRRKFYLADEPKVEKVIIENKIAEQTVTDAITEPSAPEQTAAPKLGFKPKFKTTESPASAPDEKIPGTSAEKTELSVQEQAASPKLGFKPKFKPAASPASAPTENEPAAPEEKAEPSASEQNTPPKLGFKPKFRSAASNNEGINAPETDANQKIPLQGAPGLGFKPKFKSAANPASAPVENEPSAPEEKVETSSPEQIAPAKLGFKPKFKPAVSATPIPAEDTPAVLAEKNEPSTQKQTDAPKLGFKPKFRSAAIASTENTPATSKETVKSSNTAETTAPKTDDNQKLPLQGTEGLE